VVRQAGVVDQNVSASDIRKANPSDGESAGDLWIRSRRSSIPAIPAPAHNDEAVRSWFTSEVIPKGGTWVMEDGGKMVALLVLDDAWIDQLYVHPDHTGHGHGSRLIDYAKRISGGTLDLWTFRSNVRAQVFYERHGFVAVGGTDGDNEENAPAIRYQWSAGS
jgi:GNAT superfamily N-acetyltransferase